MNTLAATYEIGAHPATALLIGGLAAAVFARSICINCTDIVSNFWILACLRPRAWWSIHSQSFWLRTSWSVCRSTSKGFWISFSYRRLGCRDLFISCEGSMAGFHGLILCSNCSWCGFCRGYAFALSFGGKVRRSLLFFQIWGQKTKTAEDSGFRYLFFHVSSGLLLLFGVLLRYHGEGASAFLLNP